MPESVEKLNFVSNRGEESSMLELLILKEQGKTSTVFHDHSSGYSVCPTQLLDLDAYQKVLTTSCSEYKCIRIGSPEAAIFAAAGDRPVTCLEGYHICR